LISYWWVAVLVVVDVEVEVAVLAAILHILIKL